MPEEVVPKKKSDKGDVRKAVEQIIKKTAETQNPEIALKRDRIKAIVSFAVFLLILAVLVFFIAFSFWKIKKESSIFLAEKSQIAVLTSQSVDIESFKNNYDSYKDNFQKIEAMFVDQQNPLSFIKFLEDSAVLSKVEISISPPSYVQEGAQKFINVQVSCSGQLPGELKFLETIENGPYLVSVQSVSLSGLQPVKGQQAPRATFLVKALSR